MTSDVVVEAERVSVTFGDTRALVECSFSARSGEIHAIVGENGSGKSTLAKSIAGVVRPQGGTIRVAGSECRSPIQARSLGLAMVFQEVLVAAQASVTDNVYLGWDGLFRHKISEQAKRQTTADLIERLTGEPIDPDSPAGDLPLDVRQWIVVARALVRSPRILILDEATAALDLAGAQRLHSVMVDLRNEGCAVLLVTHRIAELTAFADRASVLRDGRDVGVLAGSEIREDRLLELMSAESSEDRSSEEHRPHPEPGRPVLMGEGLQLRPGVPSFAFTLRSGEVVGVAGLDGQGQSLFVRALAGVDPLYEGTIEVETSAGCRAVGDIREAADSRIAYVSGDRKRDGIFPNLSIFENFAAALYPSKSTATFINFRAIMKLFRDQVASLAIKIGKPSDGIETLSGGHQQKVLIGRALALDPEIIVLNDPARGVDIRTKKELHRHLREEADSGRAVVYLSTELEEFPGFVDRILVFRDGTLAEELKAPAIEPDRVLKAMFGYQSSGSVADAIGALE